MVPRLWSETIDAHRSHVRDSILDTTWQLVTERGLLSVTMSQIAAQTGIGRATLYKYFPNVEAILVAHHARHAGQHLERLAELRDRPGSPDERLQEILKAYALICWHREQHRSPELMALLHEPAHVAALEERIRGLFADLLKEGAAAGEVREDAAPEELANYCLHALGAAGRSRSEAGVLRLVAVILAGLAPSPR